MGGWEGSGNSNSGLHSSDLKTKFRVTKKWCLQNGVKIKKIHGFELVTSRRIITGTSEQVWGSWVVALQPECVDYRGCSSEPGFGFYEKQSDVR